MKHPITAGLAAGAIAVTAGGGVGIVAEGWHEAALVALAVASAFGLGSWFADRRVAAVLALVRSFCEEAAVYYRAREDGRIDDAEARAVADAAGRRWLRPGWLVRGPAGRGRARGRPVVPRDAPGRALSAAGTRGFLPWR